MADTPLFSTIENAENSRDILNVQKQVLDTLLAHKREYQEIGRIRLDVEKRVVERRKEERRLMDDLSNKYVELEAANMKAVAAIGTADMNTAKQQVESIKSAILNIKKMASIYRQVNAIEIDMAKRRYEDEHKFLTFASAQAKNLFGIKVNEYDVTKGIGEELIKVGVRGEMIAYTWGAILMILKGAYDLFNKFDKAAQDFRMSMGMTRAESRIIRGDAERIAIDYMSMGVSIESVYKSYQALGKSVGGIHNVTKSMAEEVALMSAQLQISEEASTGFLRNMAVISKHTMESQTAMMYIAKYISNAAGVPLVEVMQDVSKASNRTLTMMSRIPNVVLRTAIELRRMGTDMNKAADAGAHVLDFTQSINEEMEASVLLGRSINMQRVRELAYSRNLEGSTKEILRLSKEHGFATKMDYFQMKAFAQMTGFSVDQLLNMVQTSDQLEKVRRNGTTKQKEQLALYEKMRNENEKAAKARAKDVETQLRTIGNQTQLVRLQNNWNSLMAKMQQVLLPVIDKILGFINDHFKAIKWIAIVIGGIWLANKLILLAQNSALIFQNALLLKNAIVSGNIWRGLGTGFVKYLPGIASLFSWLGNALFTFGMDIIGLGGTIWTSISGLFVGFGTYMGTLLTSSLSGIVSAGAGAMAAAGASILAAFAAGFGIGTLLRKIFPAIDEFATWAWLKLFDMWDGMVAGIKSIGPKVWRWIKWPFDKFSEWWYGVSGLPGKSASKLGLSIVTGILSVGTMIFDALTSPFRRGIAWIADKIPGMSKFADKLRGGVQGMTKPLENRAQAAYIPAVTVTPKGTEIAKAKDKAKREGEKEKEESALMSEATGCKIVALLEKILAKDSNIHMDGSLVSTTLARSIEFRGHYGVNK